MDPKEFIDFWRGLAEMVSFSEIIDFHDLEENPAPEGFVCPETFQKLAIWSNGRISPCCSDINLHFQLGRIPEVSLRQVWNGPAMSNIRRMHLEGRAAEFPACRACWRLRIEEEER
jgi:radical SAM protein with 4Fe4S-binding SPASM domain